MGAYLARRLLTSLLVLAGVSLLTFSMLRLVPGDPVTVLLGRQAVSKEQAAALREELGLNDPLPVQYWHYIRGVAQGDLGNSIRSGRPVAEMIREQLPSTIQLTVAAMLLAVVIGLGLGMLGALRHGTWVDTAVMSLAVSGISIPSFWLGLLLIMIFSVGLGWLPSVAGSDDWRGLILPAVTLGVAEASVIARIVRASMVDTLDQDYMRTAQAKGLPRTRTILRHALPNALIPVVTIVGLQVGFLLAGSTVVETIFARQGIGRLAVTAVNSRDFPVVQGVVLVTASIYVLINTLTDILYAYLNPRIRLQ
jgi:ABC-type dipeptide/oligopeptide/nickel transport system permease component